MKEVAEGEQGERKAGKKERSSGKSCGKPILRTHEESAEKRRTQGKPHG